MIEKPVMQSPAVVESFRPSHEVQSLHEEHRAMLVTFALGLGAKNKEVAEDLVSEVMADLFIAMREGKIVARLDDTRAALMSMIAKRRNSQYRTEKRRSDMRNEMVPAAAIEYREDLPSLPFVKPVASWMYPEVAVEMEEELRVLEESVASLPPESQVVIRLCCMEGKRSDEVAKQLGIQPQSVRKRMMTAMKQLRAEVARRGLGPNTEGRTHTDTGKGGRR